MKATQTTDETWLPVVGVEDTYEISDHGRIRSIDRVIQTGNGPRFFTGRVLATTFGPYEQVVVTRMCARTVVRIHVAVLAAFVGPRPDGMQVCHNNGDRRDNTLPNLRYDTASANGLDTTAHGANVFANRTHCKHNHEFTPENTAIRTDSPNARRCLTCKRNYNRARSAA